MASGKSLCSILEVMRRMGVALLWLLLNANGVFPFRLLPFRLLPFRLLPFRLLPFRLLSNVKSVPFRLLSIFLYIVIFKGILIKPVHICTTLMGQKKV